jgi:hypothetical protein
MDNFELSDDEARLQAAILERHAGKGDMGEDSDWPLQDIFEMNLPVPIDGDDAGHQRREEVCRTITVAVAAAGCLRSGAATNELAFAWSTGNSPERVVQAPDWLAAFDAVGYISDEDSPQDAPNGDQVLYRGATPKRRLGLAWTERRAVAELFTNELKERGEDGRIYRAHVESWRVKARFNTRDEREWVIDTTDLATELDDEGTCGR